MAGSLDVSQQIQTGTVLVAPARSIGGLIANATLEEIHSDDLEITEHPIDQGASVTDHAYMRPREVMIRFGFSNSQGAGGAYSGASILGVKLPTAPSVLAGASAEQVDTTYQKLLSMQATRQLINVFTARRKYGNMLIKSLKVTTNKETENALIVEAVFRQVILVSTQVATISAPPENQTQAKETCLKQDAGTKNLSSAPTADSPAAAKAVTPGS